MINRLMDGKHYLKIKLVGCLALIVCFNIFGYLFILLPAGLTLSCLVLRLIFKHQIRLKKLFPVLFLAVTLAFIQAFTFGSQQLYTWYVSGRAFSVYKEGLEAGVLVFLKITTCTNLLLLFFHNLKLSEFLFTLKGLRVPKAFSEVLVLAIKYIFIFKDESANIIKAQKARLGYKNFSRSLVSLGSAGGILLEQAFVKSEELARAVKSRGYDGSSLLK